MEAKPKPKKLRIRSDVYEELEQFAKKHDLTVDQLAVQLLEKEVTESAHKDLFVPGLKWSVPKKSVMFARIRKEDLPRLQQWLTQKDCLDIFISGQEGELQICNRALSGN